MGGHFVNERTVPEWGINCEIPIILPQICIVGGVSLEPAGKGCQLLYCARLVKVRFEYSKCFFVQ